MTARQNAAQIYIDAAPVRTDPSGADHPNPRDFDDHMEYHAAASEYARREDAQWAIEERESTETLLYDLMEHMETVAYCAATCYHRGNSPVHGDRGLDREPTGGNYNASERRKFKKHAEIYLDAVNNLRLLYNNLCKCGIINNNSMINSAVEEAARWRELLAEDQIPNYIK